MTTDDFILHCREQAGWCADLGSAFMSALCEAFARDAEAGGVVAKLAATIPPPHRKRATSLRLAGALHHAVLTGSAPALADLYPAHDRDWTMASIWPIASAYLKEHFETVAAFIQSDPQTNETRRAIALLPGFLEIAKQFEGPLHLLELGASAGLLQNWDAFSYATDQWSLSPETESRVRISTRWNAPRLSGTIPNIASRAACDLNPIALSNPGAPERLLAYVWADQTDRLERTRAAIDIAIARGTKVEKADAAAWTERQLAQRPEHGTTVVFHSVFLHYPPQAIRKRITNAICEAGDSATPSAPLAWLCMEPDSVFESDNPKLGAFQVRLQTWPGGAVRVLGYTDGHVTRFDAPA